MLVLLDRVCAFSVRDLAFLAGLFSLKLASNLDLPQEYTASINKQHHKSCRGISARGVSSTYLYVALFVPTSVLQPPNPHRRISWAATQVPEPAPCVGRFNRSLGATSYHDTHTHTSFCVFLFFVSMSYLASILRSAI